METLFIYLLKASGLIATFYLAYHFLVRKETFFNSNRWFLLSGLFTSLLLPLFFIKKIMLVEKPKISMGDLVAYSQQSAKTIQDVPVVEAFDWMQFIWISYIIIACLLVIKIVFNLTSLYRMLYQQQIIKREQFKLINLNENIAPFSFFNYIVYNSDLYSNEELQSILLHEKIHSQQKHSLDVLVAKLFCVVFWFNPFMWLYKKAITQNLEYIADQKAIQQLEDKKSYQRALLKVVSHQSCLSITNNFYQSLIKKRIVMLNTNQSHKRNSLKYALIIPALIGFVLLFQIKVIAQEKEESTFNKRVPSADEINVVINKNSTDAKMKEDAALLKKEHGITLKYSKVKRNSSGEITGIKVEFKDKDGNKGVSQVDGKEPIKPMKFYKYNSSIGFGQPRQIRMYTNYGSGQNYNTPMAMGMNDSVSVVGNFDIDLDIEAPEAPEAPESPEAPEAMGWNDDQNSNIVIKRSGDKKPIVIINGKVITDEKEIAEAMEKYGAKGKGFSFSASSDGDEKQIIINGEDVMRIRNNALANVDIQMKKMRPMMAKQMEMVKAEKGRVKAEMAKVRAEMDRNRPEMERARRAMQDSKPEIEAAKAEMLNAKAEMEKAKSEMEAARAEYTKAKAALKDRK